MQVSYTDDKIVFVDDKGRAESLEMFDAMSDADSIRAIATELKAAGSASKGAISLLSQMLASPRLDGYKGNTPINEAVPSELKAAIREIEVEFLKPIFTKQHTDKGAKEATVEKLWQEYAGGLKAGGSYAVAKSEATKFFAFCGKTPKADNGKLLSVAAIKKLVQEAKKNAEPVEKTGICGKLMALAHELDTRTESTILGSSASAIAALKAMLATYEGILREEMEAAQVTHEHKTVGNVAEAAKAVTGRFQRAPHPETDAAAKADADLVAQIAALMPEDSLV